MRQWKLFWQTYEVQFHMLVSELETRCFTTCGLIISKWTLYCLRLSLMILTYGMLLSCYLSLAAQLVVLFVCLLAIIAFFFPASHLGVKGKQKCYSTRNFSRITKLPKTSILKWRFSATTRVKLCSSCVFCADTLFVHLQRRSIERIHARSITGL